jgi:hypothetical protein
MAMLVKECKVQKEGLGVGDERRGRGEGRKVNTTGEEKSK